MRTLIAVLATVALLAACGYKGPLYLPSAPPKHKRSNSQPAASAPKAEAAPQASQPKEEKR